MKRIYSALFALALFAVMAFTLPQESKDELELIPIDTDIELKDQTPATDEFDYEA